MVLARKRVYPHTTLLVLMVVPCVLSLLLMVVPESIVIVVLVDTVDPCPGDGSIVISLPRTRDFSASRRLERVASLNKPHNVTLTVVHHRNRRREDAVVGAR